MVEHLHRGLQVHLDRYHRLSQVVIGMPLPLLLLPLLLLLQQQLLPFLLLLQQLLLPLVMLVSL